MKRKSKNMTIIASLLLIGIFFVPIWHIQLDAPQYPEGLDMHIWVNQITGSNEFTLKNINILNHYVGMQPINPDSFKELEIMPYVVVGFVLIGFLVALTNNKKLLLGWLCLMIVGGTVGLIDFYVWLQEFGNNLNPDAPIKMEGMTYSPPFIGTKTLLNITAVSLPAIGSLFFGISVLLASLACFWEFKRADQEVKQKKITLSAIAACFLMAFTSCQPKPSPIEYGFDACSYCKMTIADERYASELVTTKGKVYKFDAIECLVSFQKTSDHEYALELLSNFSNPGEFIEAKTAWILKSENMPSPMGMNLNAFASKNIAEDFQKEKSGKLMNWEETKKLNIGHQQMH